MIRLLFALLCLLGREGVYRQGRNPVDWQFSARKIDGMAYEVSLRARIQPPWHIYAQDCPEDLTLPTSIQFTNIPLIAG